MHFKIQLQIIQLKRKLILQKNKNNKLQKENASNHRY